MTFKEDVEMGPKGFMQVQNVHVDKWLGILLWEL